MSKMAMMEVIRKFFILFSFKDTKNLNMLKTTQRTNPQNHSPQPILQALRYF